MAPLPSVNDQNINLKLLILEGIPQHPAHIIACRKSKTDYKNSFAKSFGASFDQIYDNTDQGES